jgi:hypothetical protein
MPDHDQRLLVSDINLYVLPSATNVLYVQVTNVLTTEGAFWFGAAFDDVTQTGVRITFPDSSLLTPGVSFATSFANPGEVLADGTSGTEVVTPLSDTPGFALQVADTALLINTTDGSNNGFTSLCCIFGATRIRGGGVFQLTFAQSVDLTTLDFSKLIVESEYGRGNQYILATVLDDIPPTTDANASPNPNANSWNNTNVTVTLNATDNPGGSGVKEIQFSLSGAQNAPLQTVAGSAASVTISAEGTTTLTYFATDNAGNQETAKTLTVRIDETPPVISGMPAPGCSIWPPNHKLVQVATATATDSLSGLAPGSFQVTGTSSDPANGQIVITGGPSQFNVQLGADKDEIYTLTATASDLAGNITTQQASCSVPHDQGK